MTSRTKSKLTVERGKALRFISKQEFYKMEATAQEKGNVRILERDWYQTSTDNESYARKICSYAVQRHLVLLEKYIECSNAKDPKRMQLIATRDHLKQKTQICINNKILQFYQFVGLQRNAPLMFMQQPFIVQGAMPMMNHPMHHMAAMQHYQHPYAQLQPINPMNQQTFRNNIKMQHPLHKRAKLSHSNIQKKSIERTKEEIENEKIKKVTLPQNLINSNKLKQWLDDKLNTLKEYEALVIKLSRNKEYLQQKKSAIKNLRRDIDILKSTVLQENSATLAQNKELKKIYLDIMKMDKDLPILRKDCIKPLIDEYVAKFQKCDVIQSINAQNAIKDILIKNKFDDKAKEFCNIYNKQYINHELFVSEINNTLNDDLELLKDFGVKYYVERVNIDTFNLKVTFRGHFGKEIDNEWIPPSLIVMIDESEYKHYYEFLPCFNDIKKGFIEFSFVLKEKRGIKRDMDAMNDDDVHLTHNSKFAEKHIKWLDQYKTNTLKCNGAFVSIVNIYNFYIDAVKTLIREMCDKAE